MIAANESLSGSRSLNKVIPMTTQKNRGTVWHDDFYPGCMADIKSSAFVNLSSRDQSKISERLVRLHMGFVRHTVFRRGSVRVLLVKYNCKEVPINPIIKPRTHYYSSANPWYVTICLNLHTWHLI
jgi:hypothetical protein